jgi:hypothetical protein
MELKQGREFVSQRFRMFQREKPGGSEDPGPFLDPAEEETNWQIGLRLITRNDILLLRA